jgi:hypothetical protein
MKKFVVFSILLVFAVFFWMGYKKSAKESEQSRKTAKNRAELEKQIKQGDMQLQICDDKIIKNPSDEDIRNAFSKLDTKTGDAFIILGPTDMTYIQSSGDRNVGFDLEYQEGTTDKHFRAKEKHITFDDVVNAFIAYRNGSTNWQDKFDFERIRW